MELKYPFPDPIQLHLWGMIGWRTNARDEPQYDAMVKGRMKEGPESWTRAPFYENEILNFLYSPPPLGSIKQRRADLHGIWWWVPERCLEYRN